MECIIFDYFFNENCCSITKIPGRVAAETDRIYQRFSHYVLHYRFKFKCFFLSMIVLYFMQWSAIGSFVIPDIINIITNIRINSRVSSSLF